MIRNDIPLPENYSDWLGWFSAMEKDELSPEQMSLLHKGRCSDFEFTGTYFCSQLEKTVNVILNRSIDTLKRKLQMQQLYSCCDCIHLLFIQLVKDSEKCLFFTKLEFLTQKYRDELFLSVKSEMQRLLDSACEDLKRQSIEENNQALLDEIRLIKRIEPYREWEKIGV